MGKRRIVIKIGSSTITYATGQLNIRRLEKIVKIASDIENSGVQLIIVTSGAVAVGMGKIGVSRRPDDIPTEQACAAIGQCELMHFYDTSFLNYSHTVAQVLLTAEDIIHEERKQHLENTLERLLELGCIPIINENDTVSVKEIGIGDNDTLSAMVAGFVGAELLVLLSDIDGLYTADPNKDSSATLIDRVVDLDYAASLASGAGALGKGGMTTKISAARIARENGIDMIIINGERPELLYDIVDGKPAGTRFFADGSGV